MYSSLQVRNELPLPCFYGRTLFRTVLAACTGPPHSEMAQNQAWAKNQDSALNSINFSQVTAVSISAYRRPIREPKKNKWSLLLSSISCHTHDLRIRGRPREPAFALCIICSCKERMGGGLVVTRPLLISQLWCGERGGGWQDVLYFRWFLLCLLLLMQDDLSLDKKWIYWIRTLISK